MASSCLLAPPLIIRGRVVLYDGVCNLCNVGVRFVAARDPDKFIYFCSVQSKSAEPYLKLAKLTRQDVLKRFIFVQPTHWSQGSTAALEVAEHMQFPWPALGVFKVVPESIRDIVYDVIAKRRYQMFGRSDVCQVPDSLIIDRFVDAHELLQGKCLKEAMKEDEE